MVGEGKGALLGCGTYSHLILGLRPLVLPGELLLQLQLLSVFRSPPLLSCKVSEKKTRKSFVEIDYAAVVVYAAVLLSHILEEFASDFFRSDDDSLHCLLQCSESEYVGSVSVWASRIC